MTRDELIALGLTQEQAEAVLAAMEDAGETHAEVDSAGLAAQLAAVQAELALRDKRDAVLDALPAYHVRDARLILRLIDLDNIETTPDNTITGLDEQMTALKTRAPYLFADAPDPEGGLPTGGMNPTEFDMNAFLRGER